MKEISWGRLYMSIFLASRSFRRLVRNSRAWKFLFLHQFPCLPPHLSVRASAIVLFSIGFLNFSGLRLMFMFRSDLDGHGHRRLCGDYCSGRGRQSRVVVAVHWPVRHHRLLIRLFRLSIWKFNELMEGVSIIRPPTPLPRIFRL